MFGKLGRNDTCWCGSGKKYKKCHEQADELVIEYEAKGYEVPERGILKTRQQIEGIRESGRINTAILDDISGFVQAGVTGEALDRRIYEKTLELGGVPAPLNYNGYPKSVCISIDDVVCHGIPSEQMVLKDGDIVNIDVSTEYKGYFGDSSRMFCVGQVSPEKEKLVRVAKECVELGIAKVKPWGFLGDIASVISRHAAENGYSVVREIGGHGIGLEFHEDPWVGYIGEEGTGMLLVPGMIFTIEPMINMGTDDVVTSADDGWVVRTWDGKPSAQWESMVLVTEDGCEVLAY